MERIVPGPERDLDYQSRLTGMLLRARPSYLSGDLGGDWPGVIEAALGAPVTLMSVGPTAADKLVAAPAAGLAGR
jgi:adenylosuccinate synthase